MQPNKIEDPRGPWGMARRTELVRYAHELGLADISEQMPKELIVKLMQARNVPPPRTPPRKIGSHQRSGDTTKDSHHYQGSYTAPQESERVQIDAVALAEMEWRAQQGRAPLTMAEVTPPAPAGDPLDTMAFNDMRKECKRLGIKMARRDRPDDLRAKLRAHRG